MKLITNSNLQDKDFTNAEVMAMLNKLSLELDASGFSRVRDMVEDLTGDRDFDNAEIDQAEKDLILKVAKAEALG